MQSNLNIDSEDEEELMNDCMDDDIWKRYRLSEWTEDVTITWIRSVSYGWNNNEEIYLLSEIIMKHGYDGTKLKKQNLLKKHPKRLSPSSRLKILSKLIQNLVFCN